MSALRPITIYTRDKSLSCAEAISWMKENKIPYFERRVDIDNPLRFDEIMTFLHLVEEVNNLLSRKSNQWREIERCYLDMHIQSELIPFIQRNPTVLKFPIIVRGFDVTAGFHSERYGTYLSKEQKRQKLDNLLKAAGS